jgi:copper/silver efflux system protein
LRNLHELQEAILQGAVKRLRPKFMTMAAAFLGLVPIMWSTGAGSDVMKRIAAPIIGGILTSFLLELLVYPAIYQIWKWNFELKRQVVLDPNPLLDANPSLIEYPGEGQEGASITRVSVS